MKSARSCPDGSDPDIYRDPRYRKAQEGFDALVAGGARALERAHFIEKVYIERNREIRNLDFRDLRPSMVAEDYLLPRRDLSRFVLVNWIRDVFLPSLRAETAASLFVFGIGRLFSSYNDTGVQHSTDADINIVVADELPAQERTRVGKGLDQLKKTLLERFQLRLEVDPSFTVLSVAEVRARLAAADGETRARSILFYKSNCRTLMIIRDQPVLREAVFSRVRELPDSLLFEHFLGLSNPGTTFMRLRAGAKSLLVLADGSCDPLWTTDVVGSRPFDQRFRRSLPRGSFISPPDWYFSMKHFVNRPYDYVCSMRDLGYSLEEIGFDRVAEKLGVDPDYRFLRDAHRLMLYLQELVQIVMGSFNEAADCSYLSRARFLRFVEVDGDKFRKDFEEMVLGGDLLLPSEKTAWKTMRQKIGAKTNDRYLEGKAAEFGQLPEGLRYDLVFSDASGFKILVPWSWADLGYFVFASIAARMGTIVEGRLVPALGALGLPPELLRAYAPQAEARR